MLEKNQTAPAFSTKNQHNAIVELSSFNGSKNVVLYFYPKDDTPGCTIEANDFTRLANEFAAVDTVVIGVSKDSCRSHANFTDKKDLTIMLLSDPEHKLQDDYAVWQPKKFMGKEFMGTLRSTFIIDPKGLIADAQYKVSANGHAKAILDKLRDLQK